MIDRPSIALVVDHPERDLPGLVLLAHELASRGAKVFLIPLNLLGVEVAAIGPDYLVLNYLRRHIEWVVRGALDAGIGYGVVDTEGGFYGDLDVYGGTFVTDRALLEGLSVLCAWGPKVADYVTRAGLLDPSQVCVTGVPRFDFYAPRWRRFFDEADDDRPLVLFNTKVAVANPQHQTIEDEMSLYVDKLGYSRAQVERYRDVGLKSIDATIDLANRLAAERPGERFVLRPHPHERLQTYADRVAAGVSNLEVRREGTVDSWIVRSRALIHRQCTTAIEAGFAGVPALAPLWVPTAADAPDTERVSLLIETYDELTSVLDAIADGEDVVTRDIRAALDSIIEQWLFAVDGGAHERVADQILGRLPSRRAVIKTEVLERMFYRLHEPVTSMRGLAGRVGRAGAKVGARRAVVRALHPAVAAWDTSTKVFTPAEVRRIVDRITDLEPGGAVSVSAAAPDDYLWGYHGRAVVLQRTDGGSRPERTTA
jgi:surface carbohydrate biosynthesis protein